MSSKTENNRKISEGIRLLDKKYFDFLYEIKDLFQSDENLSLKKFITEITDHGNVTMVFNTIKGKSLRNDIRREINELYAMVYNDSENADLIA